MEHPRLPGSPSPIETGWKAKGSPRKRGRKGTGSDAGLATGASTALLRLPRDGAAGRGREQRAPGTEGLACRTSGDVTVAIRSSKLVVPTVTKADFMAEWVREGRLDHREGEARVAPTNFR